MTSEPVNEARVSFALHFPRLDREWRESKALLALAAPIAGAALVNMGMSITDTVMMGWIGPTALAAGAVVSDLHSIVFYFMAGVLSIVAPMIARSIGADDPDGARRTVRSGFAAAAILSPPAFLAVWHAADLIHLFGVGGPVLALGREYAQAMAFTIVPMLFVSVWRHLFAAIGRPRIYLVAIIAALPLNAVANWVLMFGVGPIPALGIVGAGIASAIVAFGLLIGFVVFTGWARQLSRLDPLRSSWRIDRAELGEVFRLGLPIGLFTIGEVGIFLLATVVIALFGTEALAAHAITLRIAGVIYAIPTGLSQAATIRVSHAIGRDDRPGLSLAMRTAMGVGVASGTAILAFLVGAADFIPVAFLQDGGAAITAVVSSLLVLLGVLNFAQGFAGPATAILRGFKDTRMPMVLCLTGYWLVGMPVAGLAAFHLGLEAYGIWIGLALGVVATAALMNLRLVRWDVEMR